MKILGDRSIFQTFPDCVLLEAVLEDAVLVHHIGYENKAVFFCDPACFVQGLDLVFLCVQVIHGTEKQGKVKTFVGEKMQVTRVSRPAVDVRMFGLKDLEITGNELHGRN